MGSRCTSVSRYIPHTKILTNKIIIGETLEQNSSKNKPKPTGKKYKKYLRSMLKKRYVGTLANFIFQTERPP